MTFSLPGQPPQGYERTCLLWEGGWLEFDCVEREKIDHPGEVTEHPVDEGADIADHFRIRNIPIVLDARITNSPLSLPRTHTGGSQAVNDQIIVEVPAPIFPGAPTNLGGFPITTKKRHVLSPLNFQPEMNRVQAVYDELEACQLEARTLTVSIGTFRDYDNMLLKRWSVDRHVGVANGMDLVLELQQITKVAAKKTTINLPQPPVSPTKSRSEAKADAGKKAGKPVELKSLAKRMADGAAGLF